MTVTGPDFIALQVRDIERAAEFYETHLGLHRLPSSPPLARSYSTPHRPRSRSASRCPGST